MGRRNGLMTTLAAIAAVVLLAGCGGGDDSGSGGSDATTTARGPITYVQGKDNTNWIRPMLDKWNTAHPDEKVTFKEQSDEADQQHDDDVQHFQAKDPEYDVVSVDVVWTAEFAAKGWLHPLKDSFALDTAPLLPATVATATYNNTLFAAPVTSDGGMLYYRKDLVPTPPKTWDEMMGMCPIAKENSMDCYAGQFFKYEGLTVNAAEAINTDGGVIVGEDGKTPSVNTPEAAAGLGRLADAYKNGNIPKQAITYTEEEGRQSFQAGKLLFLRQWPYVYSLATTEGGSKVKGKFDVAPLPGVSAGDPGASSLGGHNAAHQHLLRPQGHRPRLPEVPVDRGNAEGVRDPGLQRAGPRGPVRRPSDDQGATVPADAEDLDPQRRSPPRHPLLPGRDQGGV